MCRGYGPGGGDVGEFVIDGSSFAGFVRYDFHLGGGKIRVAGANANLTATSFLTNQTPTDKDPIPHFGTGTLEFAMPENGFAGVADFPSETAAKSIGVTVITKPGFMVIVK